ncbi:MAG: hypothetical protein KF901_23325 [Myxococcales bacterium]|nr:hypothetical protein [Myxococcales bacterium]
MRLRGSRSVARGLSIVGLFVLVVGPAPGEVGGCGSEQVVADPIDYCLQTGAWDCRRQEFRGEIDDVEACVDELPEACRGAAWPAACAPFPTNREAQACLDALARVDNVYVDSNDDGVFTITDLPECRLCGGR